MQVSTGLTSDEIMHLYSSISGSVLISISSGRWNWGFPNISRLFWSQSASRLCRLTYWWSTKRTKDPQCLFLGWCGNTGTLIWLLPAISWLLLNIFIWFRFVLVIVLCSFIYSLNVVKRPEGLCKKILWLWGGQRCHCVQPLSQGMHEVCHKITP